MKMKRFSSLLFLFLILLNTFGYYQILVLVEHHLHQRAVSKITENEDEINGSLLIRVPFALPYGPSDGQYESARGEIVIDGNLYHFVKRKVFRDTLYLVCVQDVATTKARNAVADYSKSFADKHHQKPDASRRVTEPLFSSFYLSCHFSSELRSRGWVMTLWRETPENHYRYFSLNAIFHPPC